MDINVDMILNASKLLAHWPNVNPPRSGCRGKQSRIHVNRTEDAETQMHSNIRSDFVPFRIALDTCVDLRLNASNLLELKHIAYAFI